MTDRLLIAAYRSADDHVIIKPSTGKEIGHKIATFVRYWLETVALPG